MLRTRYLRTIIFFGRVIARLLFWDAFLPRIGFRGLSKRTRAARLEKIAISYRNLAIHLGGVFIKAGQFLSTRVDVLPREITSELAGLQDEVPPISFDELRRVAEEDFNTSIPIKFAQFATNPLAAASLGQAHRARLKPEDAQKVGFSHVVVKVLRPDIDKIVDTDLAAFNTVGNWLKRYPPISRRADVKALIKEFSDVLYEELDYLSEGKNAEMFAENFKDDQGVCVPRVVWSHTTRRVITLEDVSAIKITDYESISAAGIDRAEVANRLFETYLQQIFEDGFFHADPHPGNLFVSPGGCRSGENPDQYGGWQLTFVDFGMVGQVPPQIRSGLREMARGVGTRDPERIVQSYQIIGVILPGADIDMLIQAEEEVFNRFWGKSMGELQEISYDEMEEFAREFRELIYSLPFQVPSDLIYLVRCIAILSGMCTGLNPDFNVWYGLAPYAEKLIAEERDMQFENILQETGKWVSTLVQLPYQMSDVITKINRGKLEINQPKIEERLSKLQKQNRQIVYSILFGSFLFSSIQLFSLQENGLSIVSLVIAIFFLLLAIRPR